MTEPVSDAPTPPKRQPPNRKRPAQIPARALNPRHRKFADLYLSGMPAGRAYEHISEAVGDSADTMGGELLGRPRVRAYIGAVRDQSVAGVVLSQEVLHGHAMVIARGGEEIGPAMQLEAIKYLDACLNRNRIIRIEGLTLQLDADERHVAAIAYAALEAEANGEIGAEDARHLIESAALVQQIMHGATIAQDLKGEAQSRRPLRVMSGNGSTVELTTPRPDKPVRPKWLKTPEAIAE